ncbi:GNAT family N-acetyltransferase [Rhizobiaceae bacterium BDR2-2]|uniref:GNAT family N-acetyltransferase n=1 Tax=Ectorhizobium quercum TaxID=2965071 RepID=A0AAE3MY49_9HYPH|nr:GNAT family N-acetyltransferase [Ectorhizobium quercum]MCX8996611.1 GNAT family N-acetyltransferase [Ectorhizobium quercum]
MNGIVAIRRLTIDDMDAVADIYRRSFDQRLPWLASTGTREEDRIFFRETVFPHSDLWGALDNGRIVGFAAIRDIWLDHLYVLPEFQSRGVGSLLLRHCQLQNSELQLWTFQQNCGASRFYETHGFELVRATETPESRDKEPDALYHWKRPPGADLAQSIDGVIGV